MTLTVAGELKKMRLVFLTMAFLSCQSCIRVEDTPHPNPTPNIKGNIQTIALPPVQFVSSQPDSFCYPDIGDDLRRIISTRLRTKGYNPLILPDRSPQSFLLNPPPPMPGSLPELIHMATPGTDAILGIWVKYYMATGLCEGFGGGNTLEMHVEAILYALPKGEELGRWRAEEWGTGSSQETVWRVLVQITDKILVGIP